MNPPSTKETLGFIMLRHVNKPETNQYWIEAYERIRRLYPDSKIVIIDDHSRVEYIQNPGNLLNCEIVESRLPQGRGEILPFYYYYHNKYFDKAIILHDSIFLQKRMNDVGVRSIQTVQFLWNIDHVWNVPVNEIALIENTAINNKEDIKARYRNMDSWLGCFGTCCVITHRFLKMIMDKYNMESFTDTIDSREARCSFERIFGLICCMEDPLLRFVPSIYGHIQEYMDRELYYRLRFEEYMKNRGYFEESYPIVKVWSGR